ncbi:MAG: ATP-binding cassette domain-containing protein [Actinomycetota bacterium]|nr:ATP-binding cassette domain-containing protein [Actinomycetota bacterium]
MPAHEASYAIEVRELKKVYGEVTAVDGISLQVEAGELFGFLGPNGAGKTTTVNILTGVSLPTAGSASIHGHDVVRDSFRAKENLNVVPEVSNAYNEYTAWKNLVFTGALYGVPRKEAARRAEELLRTFDLYDKRDSKVKGFSQGMRRKLVIAMALINEPRVLFMDEPTTGLDVQSVLAIRDMVRDLNRMGITVFLTTHNLVEANVLCDRVAIINRGRIVATDTPENLKRAARQVQVVEVSFDRMAPETDGEVAALAGIREASRQGDKLRLITDEPSRAISAVNRFADEKDLAITYISTPGPSLEDVFVELTGIGESSEGSAER